MKALFPGSFDPFTLGHLNIASRAAKIFDEVVVAIAQDNDKNSLSAQKRKEIALISLGDKSNIKCEIFDGLTTDFASKCGCNVIIRGIRGVLDCENERALARTYKNLSGIETMLFFAEDELISSTLVRQMVKFGADISAYIAKNSLDLVQKYYK